MLLLSLNASNTYQRGSSSRVLGPRSPGLRGDRSDLTRRLLSFPASSELPRSDNNRSDAEIGVCYNLPSTPHDPPLSSGQRALDSSVRRGGTAPPRSSGASERTEGGEAKTGAQHEPNQHPPFPFSFNMSGLDADLSELTYASQGCSESRRTDVSGSPCAL